MARSAIELRDESGWLGLTVGLPRNQAVEIIREQGLNGAEDEAESMTISGTDDWEMVLHFAEAPPHALRQIGIEGGDVTWQGRPLMDARLDHALHTLAPHGPAWWTPRDELNEPHFPEDAIGAPDAPSDDALLGEGTVWLPDLGLGLIIWEGTVFGVVRRAPGDLPRQFAGPVTEAQRARSAEPDLEEQLRRDRLAKIEITKPRSPFAGLHTALNLAAIIAAALVVKSGFEAARAWSRAEVLQARVVAIEQVPMKQFRDFVPATMRWVFPKGRAVLVDAYRVSYAASDGHRGEAVLERHELFVPPERAGEDVPIAYRPGNPPEVRGLSRAQNAGFIEHTPAFIAIGVLSLLGHAVMSMLPFFVRFSRRLAPPPRRLP